MSNDPDTARAGLCAVCTHAERIKHPRGGGDYWRCLLADNDPRFMRYPRLPVRACDGFQHKDLSADDADGRR